MTDDRILELLKLNDHATSGNGLALAFGRAIANEAASEEREACATAAYRRGVMAAQLGQSQAEACARGIYMCIQERSNVEFSGGAPLHGAASAGTQGSASPPTRREN